MCQTAGGERERGRDYKPGHHKHVSMQASGNTQTVMKCHGLFCVFQAEAGVCAAPQCFDTEQDVTSAAFM